MFLREGVVESGRVSTFNGVRVLRALGLGEAVACHAAVLRRWGFFDQQDRISDEHSTYGESLWCQIQYVVYGSCIGHILQV